MNILPQILFHMTNNFFMRGIRSILSLIDMVVYSFISTVFKLIFQISDVAFDSATATAVTQKVYVILTIFMIFKITISMIQYLVNPDTLTDKQQGAGKLITRVIVTLMMLLILPFAFDKVLMDSDLHQGILTTLPRVVIGKNKIATDTKRLEDMGNEISWDILRGFTINNEKCSDFNPYTEEIDLSGSGFLAATGTNYAVTTVLDSDNINFTCTNPSNEFKIDYTPIISTAAGLFLLYILIGVTFSVGTRLFKLIVLRIIAPIPIISYIDPKSSKDGPFNKWIKTLLSTWAELYIHLGILYFIIFMVTEVFKNETSQVYGGLDTFGKIVITLSLFFFAKQAPKFIGDSLGIKSEGFGQIMKMAGAGLGIGAAAVGVGLSTTKTGGKALKNTGNAIKNFKRAANSGLTASERNAALKHGFAELGHGVGNVVGGGLTNIGSGFVGAGKALMSGKPVGAIGAGFSGQQKFIENVDKKDLAKQQNIAAKAGHLEEYVKTEAAKNKDITNTVGIKVDGLKGSYSRNQIYNAISSSAATGRNIVLGNVDLGFGAEDSRAGKMKGDADDFIGQLYLDRSNSLDPIQREKLEAKQDEYGRSMGRIPLTARKDDMKTIKANKKAAQHQVDIGKKPS